MSEENLIRLLVETGGVGGAIGGGIVWLIISLVKKKINSSIEIDGSKSTAEIEKERQYANLIIETVKKANEDGGRATEKFIEFADRNMMASTVMVNETLAGIKSMTNEMAESSKAMAQLVQATSLMVGQLKKIEVRVEAIEDRLISATGGKK
jgi:hypothetical protein